MHAKIQPGIWFNLSLILLLSSIKLYSYAQDEVDLRLKPKPSGTLYQRSNSYPGSEFLFDDWQSGELCFKNGEKINKLRLNYNAFTDDVVYAIKGNSAVMVTKHQLLGFNTINEPDARFFLLSNRIMALNSSFEKPVFLEVLHDGINKVYVHYKLRINTLLAKDNPFNKSVYYPDISYYVCIKDEVLSSPQNKKSYFNYYNKSVVKDIIRTNKLSLKNEEDLVFFISELDKLENNGRPLND